jgi:hypothetical protein
MHQNVTCDAWSQILARRSGNFGAESYGVTGERVLVASSFVVLLLRLTGRFPQQVQSDELFAALALVPGLWEGVQHSGSELYHPVFWLGIDRAGSVEETDCI